MSRYVKQRHGMVVGSDNIFFIHDGADPREGRPGPPEGVPDFRDDYRAIVSFEGIYCSQINSLNCGLLTPARQMVWKKQSIAVPKEWTDPKGEKIKYRETFDYEVLRGWWENWLNKNVGAKYDKWDTYTYNRRQDPCLFFKGRKGAIAFVREVQKHLKGIRVGLR